MYRRPYSYIVFIEIEKEIRSNELKSKPVEASSYQINIFWRENAITICCIKKYLTKSVTFVPASTEVWCSTTV